MSKPETKPIFPESEESAKFVTGISGWVDRKGRFWGNDEWMARYSGSTHRHCECGAVFRKNSYCKACNRAKDEDRYRNAERIVWDCETPLYSQTHDQYFFNIDELIDFIYEHDIESTDDLELFICEPNYFRTIDYDWFSDDLPEDGDFPKELYDAIDAFNAVINKLAPVSYSPGKFAAIVKLEK